MIIYCSENRDGATFAPHIHAFKGVRRVFVAGDGGWDTMNAVQRDALLRLLGAEPGMHEIRDPVTDELMGRHVLNP